MLIWEANLCFAYTIAVQFNTVRENLGFTAWAAVRLFLVNIGQRYCLRSTSPTVGHCRINTTPYVLANVVPIATSQPQNGVTLR